MHIIGGTYLRLEMGLHIIVLKIHYLHQLFVHLTCDYSITQKCYSFQSYKQMPLTVHSLCQFCCCITTFNFVIRYHFGYRPRPYTNSV